MAIFRQKWVDDAQARDALEILLISSHQRQILRCGLVRRGDQNIAVQKHSSTPARKRTVFADFALPRHRVGDVLERAHPAQLTKRSQSHFPRWAVGSLGFCFQRGDDLHLSPPQIPRHGQVQRPVSISF